MLSLGLVKHSTKWRKIAAILAHDEVVAYGVWCEKCDVNPG